MSQALVPAAAYLEARNKELMAIAPFVEGQDEVRRRYIWRQIIAVNQIMKNSSSLQSAKPETTYTSFAEGIMLGLEFGALAEAHLVPFGGETTLMIGYSGMRRLAKQANKQIVDIETHLVFDSDNFSYRLGLDKDLIHVPNRQGKQNKDTVTGCYTIIHLMLSDGRIYKHWSVIEPRYWKPIQDKSKSSAWHDEDNQLEMIRKTSLRYTLKDMEQSPMLAQAEQFNYATETGADVVYDAEFVDKAPERPPADTSTTGKAATILDAQTKPKEKPAPKKATKPDASKAKKTGAPPPEPQPAPEPPPPPVEPDVDVDMFDGLGPGADRPLHLGTIMLSAYALKDQPGGDDELRKILAVAGYKKIIEVSPENSAAINTAIVAATGE